MKNMRLWFTCAALLTIISTPLNAETDSPADTQNLNPKASTSTPNTTDPAPAVAPDPSLPPSTETPSAPPSTGPIAPGTPTSPPTPGPTAPGTINQVPAEIPATNAVPADAKTGASKPTIGLCVRPEDITEKTMQDWAQKIAVALFTFEPTQLESQLTALQTCFTPDGWTGFNTAFEVNKKGILDNQFTVSSSIVSSTDVVAKLIDGNWRVTLPLKVEYKNAEKTLAPQLLNVELVFTLPKREVKGAIVKPKEEVDTTSKDWKLNQVIGSPVSGQKPSTSEPTPGTPPAATTPPLDASMPPATKSIESIPPSTSPTPSAPEATPPASAP